MEVTEIKQAMEEKLSSEADQSFCYPTAGGKAWQQIY